MNISSTLFRAQPMEKSVNRAASQPSKVDSAPQDSVSFSGGSDALKTAVPFVVGAAALVGGFALGNMGGVAGAVAAVPAAAVATVGAGALGVMVDFLDFSSKSSGTLMGLAIGATAGAAVVGAGAMGGTIGGLIVGAGTALAAGAVASSVVS